MKRSSRSAETDVPYRSGHQTQPCTPEAAANTSCTFSSNLTEDEGMTHSQPSAGLSENVVSPPTIAALASLPSSSVHRDLHPLLRSLLQYTCFLSSGNLLDDLPCALQQAATKLKTFEESSPLQVPSTQCVELEGVLQKEFTRLTGGSVDYTDFSSHLLQYVCDAYGLGAASCCSGFLLLIRYLMVSASLRNASMAAAAATTAQVSASTSSPASPSSYYQHSLLLQSISHFQRDPTSAFDLGDVALQCIMIACTFFDSMQFSLDSRMEKYRSHVLEALQYDIAVVSPIEYIGAAEVMAASEVAAAAATGASETSPREDEGRCCCPAAMMTEELPAATCSSSSFVSLPDADDETLLGEKKEGTSERGPHQSLADTIAATERIREVVATAKWCVMRVLCDAAAFGACSSSRLAACALAFSLIARTPPGDHRDDLTRYIESHWDPEDLLFLRRVVQVFPAQVR